jgi:Tfp pilus assembly protein PilZ
MQDKRRYKRFHVHLVELNGKMSLADKVQILDISLGGVSLKTDRRLNIGKEYLLKLQKKGKTLEVKGAVVRSELSGIEQRTDGQGVSIFTVGMMFKEGFADKLTDMLKPIDQTRTKGEAPSAADRRFHVRFNITTPEENILSYPLQFTVKSISLSGMLIQTGQPLEINSTIPMELSLNADNAVNFLGRVVSCAMTKHADPTNYDIGVEFTYLADNNTALLETFMDYLAGLGGEDKGKKQATTLL